MNKASTDISKSNELPVTRREILSWASYDIANSTYATVVATAIYNAYFVTVIAKAPETAGYGHGFGTLLLSIVIAIASALIVLTAPVLGTIADATASKKKWLFASTFCCIAATASLAFVQPGQYILASALLVVSNFAFGTGEDFIASFLPELAPKEKMGRISALGWGAGYIGGLFSLGAALVYVAWAQAHQVPQSHFVPVIMVACACAFGLLCLPTAIWLRERAVPDAGIRPSQYIKVGFERLGITLRHARHYRDLFNILLAICVYSCGTTTVTHLASVYAQEALHFTQKDSLIMILVVDITAAVGAFSFGFVQDKIGSVRTLSITLLMWLAAVLLAFMAQTKVHLWLAGNMVGLSMGACGSAGRALVGRFSPHGRSGEFLGLWGVAVKLATAIGVISFGLVTVVTGGNLRFGMLFMAVFFIVGLLLVQSVDEERGIKAAHVDVDEDV